MINSFINGSYDFPAIVDKIKSVYENVMANANISEWWSKVTDLLANVPAIAVTGVLLLLSLVMAFFGKRLLGFTRFVAFFVAGFGLSVAYLAIYIPESIPIPPLVIGIVVGVIFALLSRLLYFLAYIGSFGYCAYLICIRGYILPELTKDSKLIAIIAAAVIIVVALIAKKIIEMLGTAALGGYLASLCILEMLAQLGVNPTTPVALTSLQIIVVVVVGMFGMVVQYKTRKRKW